MPKNTLIESRKTQALTSLTMNNFANCDIAKSWLDGFEIALLEMSRLDEAQHKKLLEQVAAAQTEITQHLILRLQQHKQLSQPLIFTAITD